MAWGFFVSHYDDQTRASSDSKLDSTHSGVLYPRGKALTPLRYRETLRPSATRRRTTAGPVGSRPPEQIQSSQAESRDF